MHCIFPIQFTNLKCKYHLYTIYYKCMILYNPRSPTIILITVSFPFISVPPYLPYDPLRACIMFWLVILIQLNFRWIHFCLLCPKAGFRNTWVNMRAPAPALTGHIMRKADPVCMRSIVLGKEHTVRESNLFWKENGRERYHPRRNNVWNLKNEYSAM